MSHRSILRRLSIGVFLFPCFHVSISSAQLSSNDIARIAAECRDTAAFLSQPISATTDVERLITVGKVMPSRLHLLPVDCGSVSFGLITNSAQPIYLFQQNKKPAASGNPASRPPEPEAIRQYLCQGIKVAEPKISHTESATHYWWTREENNILIEEQYVALMIDDRDGSCVRYYNSINPAPLPVRVPDAFDAAEWVPKVERYVESHWSDLALTAFQINPSEYKPERTQSAEHFVLTGEGLLVCRFPFDLQEIHPRLDGLRLDFTRFWIDVDVLKGRIIKPPSEHKH